MIKNVLSPTNINKVELDDKEHKATVEVPDDQLSIAIGKNGQNVRLASKLSGWQIDIVSPSGEKREAGESKPEEKKLSSKEDLEASLLATVEESGDEKAEDKPMEEKPDYKTKAVVTEKPAESNEESAKSEAEEKPEEPAEKTAFIEEGDNDEEQAPGAERNKDQKEA